jgi:hypothetical protein
MQDGTSQKRAMFRNKLTGEWTVTSAIVATANTLFTMIHYYGIGQNMLQLFNTAILCCLYTCHKGTEREER